MLGLVVGFVAGLVVGWNFLDQPIWARNIVFQAKAKLIELHTRYFTKK